MNASIMKVYWLCILMNAIPTVYSSELLWLETWQQST